MIVIDPEPLPPLPPPPLEASIRDLLATVPGFDDLAAQITYHQAGRRVPMRVVRPDKVDIAAATRLAVALGPDQPVAFVALNRLVVGFNQPTTLSEASDILRDAGVTGVIRQMPTPPNTFVAETGTALKALTVADNIARRPGVRFAHPDVVARRVNHGVAPEIRITDEMGANIANGGTIDYGMTPLNEPVDMTFTIENRGTGDLMINVAELSPGFELTGLPNATIPDDETTSMTIRMLADSPGAVAGHVRILTNTIANQTFTINFTGMVDPLAGVAIRVMHDGDRLDSGDLVNFGAVNEGESADLTFTIFNDGDEDLVLGAVNPPNGYTVLQQPDSVVASGASTNFIVSLNASASGVYTGILQFLTNDPDENPFRLELVGAIAVQPGDDIQDANFPLQWHLHNSGQNGGSQLVDVNILEAWESTLGNGVTVAVLDDGTQPDHPDYAGNVIDCDNCVNGFDIDATANGGFGSHGTAVAGLVAAQANGSGGRGSAPEANLVLTSFVDEEGEQLGATDIVMNLNEAINTGAAIHTNSWGYVSATYLTDLEREAIEDLSVNARDGRGVLFLFAAGNEGVPALWDSALATMEATMGVGGVTNTGRRIYSYGHGVDITSPTNGGTRGIFTTDVVGTGGYNSNTTANGGDFVSSFGGTSAATPIAAGVAALVVAENPNLYASQVRRILQHTAASNISRRVLLHRDTTRGAFPGFEGFDESFGYGLINAGDAVQAASDAASGGGLTWPAPVSNFHAIGTSAHVSLSWTNPPVTANGEYAGVLLVRARGTTWRPTDGETYTVGQLVHQNVTVLAVGDHTSYTDTGATYRDDVQYAVWVYNGLGRYSFARTARIETRESNTVFYDSFESGNGWIPGGDWDRGAPDTNVIWRRIYFGPSEEEAFIYLDGFPPRVAGFNTPRTGTAVFATGLDSDYAAGVDHQLYSPVLDLRNTTYESIRLSFWEVLDIESAAGEFVRVEVTTGPVDDPEVLAVLRDEQPVGTYQWTPRSYSLTRFQGQEIRVRFTLVSDAPAIGRASTFSGWYLDDFRVTGSGDSTPPTVGPRQPRLIVIPPFGSFIVPFDEGQPMFDAADANGDGSVNLVDLSTVLSSFGLDQADSRFNPDADINRDGRVNKDDIALIYHVLTGGR